MLTQFSVKMPDRPGMLAEFTKMLNDNNINIISITVSQIAGLVLFIANKPKKLTNILKEKNFEFTTKDVIAVLLPDNPTSSEQIQKVAQALGDNDVNISFIYSTYIMKGPMLIVHVSNIDKAIDVLKSNGMYLYE